MSVESEILRIQHNIANTYAAVSEKGGEVPLQPTSANLAAAVDSIPQTLPPPDNNPIGTVISYMGLTAPKDYLACDGAEYNIADYPALAAHFSAQFGTSNHFGGDGTTTFAVPDMRNLFLRGYHGGAEEQLSGDVGVKQEGTEHSGISAGGTYINWPHTAIGFDQYDKAVTAPAGSYFLPTSNYNENNVWPGLYTSRPVNMAVLYCIKATESVPAENVYSTEETRIGTWIDGKPLYRKCYTGVLGAIGPITRIDTLDDIGDVVLFNGSSFNSSMDAAPLEANSGWSASIDSSGHVSVFVRASAFAMKKFILIIQYTKTTDQATIELPSTAEASQFQVLYAAAPQSAAAAVLDTEVKTEEV